jgi:uncharacterized protein
LPCTIPVEMLQSHMMLPNEAVLVFARKPQAGVSKTRLSPLLSPAEAAGLYTCFLKDTLALAEQCVPDGPAASPARFLAYTPPGARDYFAGLAPGFRLLPQMGTSLGKRMHLALENVLTRGMNRAILIGSDLPHLSPRQLETALLALRRGADLVLGPALDGGYYLIGLSRPYAELFDLPMGNSQVLARTLERAARLRLEVFHLPVTFDIDTVSDLERLESLLQQEPSIAALHTRAWFHRQSAG